jgi:hypothetical protein
MIRETSPEAKEPRHSIGNACQMNSAINICCPLAPPLPAIGIVVQRQHLVDLALANLVQLFQIAAVHILSDGVAIFLSSHP